MFASSIHAYLCASFGDRALEVGPFCVVINTHDANPYRNYAVPRSAAISDDDVTQLVAFMESQGRYPRLEYVPSVCPHLEELLVGHGFSVELRTPVMTCTGNDLVVRQDPDGIEVRLATTDDDLWLTVAATHDAYDEPEPPGQYDVDGQRQLLALGGLVALAVDVASGLGVGGAVCPPPLQGISEIAGVGVRSGLRRRGIASALVALLTREGVRVGITSPYLTPAGPVEARIYEGVGYRAVDEMLHVSKPPS